MSDDDLKAELERLHNENAALLLLAVHVSCGSRTNEAGVYSVSLSEPRPPLGWFALQPASCRLKY